MNSRKNNTSGETHPQKKNTRSKSKEEDRESAKEHEDLEKQDEDTNEHGGLPERDLRKNLGCGG